MFASYAPLFNRLLFPTTIRRPHIFSSYRPFSSSFICNLPKKSSSNKGAVIAEKEPKSTKKKKEKSSKEENNKSRKTRTREVELMDGNRRVLCVAEKNDAAKNIVKHLSRGRMRTENGVSKYNKNYVFEAPFQNVNHTFVFTSVSGHLMNYEFDQSHRQWVETRIYDLFYGKIMLDVIPSMRDIETNLKRESRKARMLIIWTDCDREGEYIGNEIVKVCTAENRNLIVRRARFSEITELAVMRAINNLVVIDQNTVAAVDSRMELDLRIGAAFTRLQTLYLKKNFHHLLSNPDPKAVLSYGSCQFPTLGFVVERYKEHKEFVSEEFWKLSGRDEQNKVDFLWEREELSTQLFVREAAEALFELCNQFKETAKVKIVDEHPKSKWRPQPLDTLQMQKLGSKHMKMSGKRVLDTAERLYQQGFISYPRTETNCYSNDFNLSELVVKFTQHLEWGNFAQEIQHRGGPRPRNGRKTDNAHPPIHPVKSANRAEIAGIDEWKVYELICRHFLASMSRDATGKETKVKVEVNEEIFVATGLVIEDHGYLQIYPFEKWTDKELPKYFVGQRLSAFHIRLSNGFTQAPPLLTEADLISLMDRKGIGTDATHADHIETIKKRSYVVLNGTSRFEPTNLGLALINGYDRMGHTHKVSKPELRAALEADLVKICEGKKTKDAVLQEQLKIYKEIFRDTELKLHLLGESLRVVEHQNNGQVR